MEMLELKPAFSVLPVMASSSSEPFKSSPVAVALDVANGSASVAFAPMNKAELTVLLAEAS